VPHHQPYSPAHGDIWALGCILAEMIAGVRPWWMATPEDKDYSDYLMDRTVLFDMLPVSNSAYLLLRSIFSPSRSGGRHSPRSAKRCSRWIRSSSPTRRRRSVDGPIAWRSRCCGRCAHAELSLSHNAPLVRRRPRVFLPSVWSRRRRHAIPRLIDFSV
jgi:serine/threonine protein kinase